MIRTGFFIFQYMVSQNHLQKHIQYYYNSFSLI